MWLAHMRKNFFANNDWLLEMCIQETGLQSQAFILHLGEAKQFKNMSSSVRSTQNSTVFITGMIWYDP